MKIAKVITTCYDCEHCCKIVSEKDRHTRAFICAFETDNRDDFEPFLLQFTRDSGTHEQPIPDNCPLEDYKETDK